MICESCLVRTGREDYDPSGCCLPELCESPLHGRTSPAMVKVRASIFRAGLSAVLELPEDAVRLMGARLPCEVGVAVGAGEDGWALGVAPAEDAKGLYGASEAADGGF